MKNIFAALSISLLLASSAVAAVLPAERLLPDDTLFMTSIPDYLKARDVYLNSPHGKLWNDPSMKDFREKFIKKFRSEYLVPLERDLGVKFDDYTNLLQGQVTFAVISGGKDSQGPALLFLLDTKGKSGQLTTNLANLKQKWVDSGKVVKTEKIRDIDFSVVPLTADNLPKSLKQPAPAPGLPEPLISPETKNAKSQLYIGQAESLLLIGNSPKVIEKVLIRMSGGPIKTVGELAAFTADEALFHDAPIFGWLNSKAIVDLLGHPAAESDDASNPFGFKPDKIIAALGLNSLNSAAYNYRYANDGAQFNLMFSVPEASRTGLIKILAGEAKEFVPPAFVPADVVKFQRWRIDGHKTWTSLRKMANEISPALVGIVDLSLNTAEANAKEKDPNFSFEKNLFGNLGDDVITYQKGPRSLTLADLNSPPSIFLIASPNAEQLANAMKNVLVIYSQQPNTTDREFLGHKIYSIETPAAPAPRGAPPAKPATLSYTFGGGYLAISSDPGMLEEYLRSTESQGKSLRDTPGLSDATQKVAGAGTSLFGYSNESESMRSVFETLKKDPTAADPFAGLTPLIAAMGKGDIKTSDWLDVSLLPPFEKISKYFYFSVYSGNSTADGLTFKFFVPTPPQMNK